MEYHAVAVGPLDLAAGVDFITEPGSHTIPWISANIYNASGTRIFPPFLTIEIAGLKIALLGISGKVKKEVPGIVVKNWKEELTDLLPSLSSTHDLVVLLATLSYNTLTTITDQFPEIQIIFGADRRKGNINGHLLNKTVVAQTASQGKYLGKLSLNWHHKAWGEDQSKRVENLKKRYVSVTKQLQHLSRNGSTNTPDYQRKTELLEQKKVEISSEIHTIEKSLQSESATDPPSNFSVTLIPLSSKIPESPTIRDIVNSAKKNIQLSSKK